MRTKYYDIQYLWRPSFSLQYYCIFVFFNIISIKHISLISIKMTKKKNDKVDRYILGTASVRNDGFESR